MIGVSDVARSKLRLALMAEKSLGSPGTLRRRLHLVDDAPSPNAQVAKPSAPMTADNVAEVANKAKPVATQLFPAQVRAPTGPNRPSFESVILPSDQKLALLQAMDEMEVKICTKCDLCKTRTKTVFGVGDHDAKLMFIGEGPGENEDLKGEPFVGKAGQLLDKMIHAMGMTRQNVYIANIVKCRPPENRVPSLLEVTTCTPFLERQIETIRPSIIVTLGLPSTQYMLQCKLSMSKMRGVWHAWRGIKLMPTYHPAYLLRAYTEENRRAVWSDLQRVVAELKLPSA